MRTSADTRRPLTRRQLLQATAAVAGSSVAAHLFRTPLGAVETWLLPQAAQADALDKMRAQMGSAPIATARLGDGLTMLSGPGGNVVVLAGADGKIVVDTFVQPAWTDLSKTLTGMEGGPVKLVIDTHWHFDHTDNNAHFRKAGAGILAHATTTKRMSQSHELLGMTIPPSPPEARPTQTFTDSHKLQASGEAIQLGYVPAAHTDTDIWIHFTKSDVLHLGDLYFNGMYPFIDAGTGGTMNGMIAAADQALKTADASMKIVPGHGALSNRGELVEYRDMLVTVRDRVQKLKAEGRTVKEAVAAKPTADLDATWAKGFMQPDMFVTIVFNTL